MRNHASNYNYLTDDEALSFIHTLTGELRKLAEDRDFGLVTSSLSHAERTTKAMQRVTELTAN